MRGHALLLRLGLPIRVIAATIGVSTSLVALWRARWRLPSELRRDQLELAFGIPSESWTERREGRR